MFFADEGVQTMVHFADIDECVLGGVHMFQLHHLIWDRIDDQGWRSYLPQIGGLLR